MYEGLFFEPINSDLQGAKPELHNQSSRTAPSAEGTQFLQMDGVSRRR